MTMAYKTKLQQNLKEKLQNTIIFFFPNGTLRKMKNPYW